MALNQLPVAGKLFEVQDGTKYAYVHIPSAVSKPTFLLLHGFPSSSYDWRFQIKTLADLGYGVIVPDLLGYGDTDKPAELERYKFKKMASDIVQILDKESIGTVIGVSHDWGSGLLSRLVNYHPDRFSALVFTSVPYMEPGPFDLDGLNAMTEAAFGYPTFGYQYFFNEDDAAEICNRNNESLTSLAYPTNPEIWRTHMGPIGAAKAWVTANTIKPLPAWLSESEAAVHNQIFSKGGYTGPLNWYKAAIRGLNAEDDAEIPEERKFVNARTLVVVSDQDYVTRAEVAEQLSAVRLRDFSIKKVVGCGHWIPVEKKDEFSEILVQFAEGAGGA
ncbi:putative epoxide hydrolase 2 [Venustampulla echinocandica]|uniref:Putative epoxide hydrolase 2 n=1 Tax=Venustampulla echinocandica TaxID=2656787 RepID=A0A370TIN3_9HELO|nr:putative epoxide hydrolase 2 [Venustampulla echinocandica]RDL35200.1 putative epoxide hydrolase 2 [Venustampulla echinocandica]